jgi:hypothetical protein
MEFQEGRDVPQNDDTPRSAPHLSRRTILKALGVTVIGSVASVVPIPSHIAVAATAKVGATQNSWAIAAASPIFQQAISQLKLFQFDFVIDQGHFRSVAEEPPLVGLLFQHNNTPSQRTGISMLCTVDTSTRTLRALQYVIGCCLDGTLEITSVLLDEQSIQKQFLQTRGGIMEVPGRYQEQHWSFSRSSKDIPPPPNILPLQGWPVDSSVASAWFYNGSTGVDWSGKAETRMLRCTQVTESRSTQPANVRVFDLVYDTAVV